jgi:hypothetical protein
VQWPVPRHARAPAVPREQRPLARARALGGAGGQRRSALQVRGLPTALARCGVHDQRDRAYVVRHLPPTGDRAAVRVRRSMVLAQLRGSRIR